ncbi:MAG: GGDEF domain-containing protein [Thalassotalea sp.]
MKLRNKVILLPTLIMLAIFIVGMLSIEVYLKDVLTQNLRERLHTLSSFTLKSIQLIEEKNNKKAVAPKFDLLADQIGKSNQVRVSFFDIDGNMLGDSELSLAQIAKVENHKNRPEIIEARQFMTSSSSRYSQTLKQNMAYFTEFDPDSGYFARIAINSNIYQQTIINLRWRFSIIIFITIAVMIIFGLLTMQLISKIVSRVRAQQEQKITLKTRQITLIQTMSTMLNSLNCLTDADRIISNIIPKLLPKYSGAIFLKEKSKRKLQPLISWGDNWSDEVSVISSWRQKITNDIDTVSENDLHINKNIIYAGLKVNNIDLGVIYLISPHDEISESEQQLIENLTQQMSFAFANLSIKNKLRDQAIRDPLTDLYNRRFMFEAFDQALNRAGRHKTSLALLMIDIDNFKLFNDTYGHDAGDHVLIQVASVLKTKLRLEDIACRFGGEEFCIICPETDLQDAYKLAEKIRDLVKNLSLSYADKPLGKITTSIGVAIHPNHGVSSADLIKNADFALYKAKDKGRDITVMANTNASSTENNHLKS